MCRGVRTSFSFSTMYPSQCTTPFFLDWDPLIAGPEIRGWAQVIYSGGDSRKCWQVNAAWDMGSKPIAGTSVTAVGSWAPSCCGPVANCRTCLRTGPSKQWGSEGVYPPTLAKSPLESFSQGPCTSWYFGLLLLQRKAWDRVTGPSSRKPGEGGYGKATNCHCSSHSLKVSLTDGCSGPTENTPTAGEFSVDCAMVGRLLLEENPSFDWVQISLLKTFPCCSSSASWGEKRSKPIFQRSLSNYPEHQHLCSCADSV